MVERIADQNEDKLTGTERVSDVVRPHQTHNSQRLVKDHKPASSRTVFKRLPARGQDMPAERIRQLL